MKHTRRWIIGDPHISHKVLDKARGWNSLIDLPIAINKLVSTNDTIYWLGDMVFGDNKEKDLRTLFSSIKCRNHKLVLGNHDAGLMMQRLKVFKSIDSFLVIEGCLLSHIPIHEYCVDSWKKNIHAHLHGGRIKDSRYACVSLERTDLKPVLLNTIIRD